MFVLCLCNRNYTKTQERGSLENKLNEEIIVNLGSDPKEEQETTHSILKHP